jgi:tetratricopeptide (TPR) repeat protein
LEQGIAACRERDNARARDLLTRAIQIDPLNEQAWLWLSGTLEDAAHRRFCLERVLAINPYNAKARQGLQWLAQHGASPAAFHPDSDPAAPASTSSIPDVARPVAGPAPAPPKGTICPWCNKYVAGLTTLDCPHCNHPLEFDCPACGQSLSPEAAECPDCGRAMGDFKQPKAYLYALGEAYLKKDWATKALAVFHLLLDLEPGNPTFLMRLSKTYEQLGQTEQSLATAQNALELDPHHLEALRRLGQWYVKSNKPDLAEPLIESLRANTKTPGHILLLGDLEYERGRYPAAFRAYSQALKHKEFDASTLARLHFRLGQMYLAIEDLQRALKEFRACVATGAEDLEVEEALHQIEALRPPLPRQALSSYGETARAMTGPLLFVWLTGALDIGFRLDRLDLAGGLGMFIALPASYLLAGAFFTPLAPEWCALMGPPGLTHPVSKLLVGLAGGGLLLLAFGLVLFGV